MDNQTFECALRAQPSYRLGEPIIVTFEIRNAGRESYRVLVWDTPLRGEPFNFLSVSRDGIELHYDGKLVRRGDRPEEGDYVTLASGESQSADVDISRLYPVQLPGEYTVTLNATLYDAFSVPSEADAGVRSVADHEPQRLAPTSVTFTVSAGDPPRMTLGEAARLDQPSAKLARISQPWVIGGTEAQQSETRSAHFYAWYLAQKAYGQLTGSNPGANSLYLKWFGINAQLFPFSGLTRYNVATMNFGSIKSKLEGPTIVLPLMYDLTGTGCHANWYAYTYTNSGKVWLCSLFWGSPLFPGPYSKAATLVHEWAHAAANLSDHAYGQPACLNLAMNNPWNAVSNPDNYAFFADEA
ncbi:M35 family metallopeptidase [Streptomyces sp. SBC-4]|nr:M35 family metallopeptidase [Streptomyces sp. SBC-4]MDV5143171.1 M35 family metallopeptidase [Streptomyces sp. SBC-4]